MKYNPYGYFIIPANLTGLARQSNSTGTFANLFPGIIGELLLLEAEATLFHTRTHTQNAVITNSRSFRFISNSSISNN